MKKQRIDRRSQQPELYDDANADQHQQGGKHDGSLSLAATHSLDLNANGEDFIPLLLQPDARQRARRRAGKGAPFCHTEIPVMARAE